MPDSAFNEHFFQSADGLQLYYRQYGQAQNGQYGGSARDGSSFSVMCLPGLTRNSRDFESLAGELAPRYHVLTPDLRGRGRSAYDPTWSNYHPAKYVEDAFRLLDATGVGRCVVIGTSLGGLMAMLMGALQPQRVAGLVINDIGPELDPAGVTRIRGYAGKLPVLRSWQEAAAQSRQIHAGAFPDFGEEDWLRFARRTYREESGAFRPDVDPDIVRAFGDPSSSAPDLWPFFRQLTMPMLIIRGALSDLLSTQTLARMRELRPDAQTVIVPGRGHAPTLEEPACRAAIVRFLEGIQ